MNRILTTVVCILIVTNAIFVWLYKSTKKDVDALTYKCVELQNQKPDVEYKVVTKTKTEYQLQAGTTIYIEKPIYVTSPETDPCQASYVDNDMFNSTQNSELTNETTGQNTVTVTRTVVVGKKWGYRYNSPNQTSNDSHSQNTSKFEGSQQTSNGKFCGFSHFQAGGGEVDVSLGLGLNVNNVTVGLSACSNKKVGVFGLYYFGK